MSPDKRDLPATEELTLARLALTEGDLAHAAAHIAGALAQAPTLPEAHELLARLAAVSGDGLDLFPLHQNVFVGTVVARAHLLAAAGRPAEGLDLLIAATGHAPAERWAEVPWVTAPDLAERLGPERTTQILMQICAATADPVPRAGRAALAPYLTLAHNAVTAHHGHALLFGAASALARRLGEVALAVQWASQGLRTTPSKIGEVWLGYALRSAGRIPDALAALERAVAHDPDDLAVYADIAGTLGDHGRLDEALDWINRALARDPTFDCAVHTAQRLRFRRDGDVAHLVALADFIREHPEDSHEHTDLAESCAGQPWLGQITPATGPAVDALRANHAGGQRGATIRLGSPVPPSALQTLTRAAPGLRVQLTQGPGPDPREPRRAVDWRLWGHDGTPAIAAPSPLAADHLRQFVHPAWPHPPAAYDAGVALATLDLTDLLGLLAHPPATPPTTLGRVLDEQDPSLWVRSVQVWACLGLLHHRTDEPWPTSTRRSVLLDLAWGVEDWATEAALFALVTVAWVDPTVRPEVATVVAERLTDAVEVTRTRPVPIARSLAHLALATPDLAPASRALAQALAGGRPPPPAATGRLRRLWRGLTTIFRRR